MTFPCIKCKIKNCVRQNDSNLGRKRQFQRVIWFFLGVWTLFGNQPPHPLAHCCTIFLKSSGYRNDDRHRNPNIHIKEIIWLGNQLSISMPAYQSSCQLRQELQWLSWSNRDPAAAARPLFQIFKFGAILPIYIHNSLSLSFSIQCKKQNQAILLHELH